MDLPRLRVPAPPAGPVAGGRGTPRDWRLAALLGLFGLSIGLRLLTPHLDSDQALTGLMGMHILRGEFPIFYWGQDHAGIPESYGAAVTFFLFGVSRVGLALVPALTALGFVLLLYRTGTVLFGRGAGLLAILFATVVSPYVARHYVLARGYYVEHLALGQVVLLGAALVLSGLGRGPATDDRVHQARLARILVAVGLAAGFGLYCGFQIVDTLLPGALALLVADPRLPARRATWFGIAAFAVGSGPFWVYNLVSDWATFATGVRFHGQQSAGEAASIVLTQLLPVVLGVQEYVDTPPYLPGAAALAVPAVATAAVALLAWRVLSGARALRRDPGLAGEALLLVTLVLSVAIVWHGRFVRVPRYLIPLTPALALILARACQLTWRRWPAIAVGGAALYLVGVGIPLAGDLRVLWPAQRAAYAANRRQDETLLAFLRARGLTRAYAADYWLAPRLTFDAREEIVVAQPFHDKYPPHTRAVDASPRPTYVSHTDPDRLAGWLSSGASRFERATIGAYTVYWDFAPPAPVGSLERRGWVIRTGAGDGSADSVADGRFDTIWASVPGPPRDAWVDVDLGRPRTITGVTLVTDLPRRLPRILEVTRADGTGEGQRVVRFETGGATVTWRNGAPRIGPGRTLTVRFPPIETSRLRLSDAGPAGTWAVAELFLLSPTETPAVTPALETGQRLEAGGAPAAALEQYRQAMRAAPDEPAGYVAFARLADELGLTTRVTVDQATRHAGLGLLPEARAIHARLAASLGRGRTHVELTRRQAELAAQAGDAVEARRLQAEADRAATPGRALDAAFGRAVTLAGASVRPIRLHPGEAIEVAYHWRLGSRPPAGLVASVHVRPTTDGGIRFDDDHELPTPLPGFGSQAQHVTEVRQVRLPPDLEPGRYRIVVGVWEPTTSHRLRLWWHGLIPTSRRTVDAGAFEVVAR